VDRPGSPPASDEGRAAAASSGGTFDPGALQRGDSIDGLRVARVDVWRPAGGGYVGSVAFDGEITVAGRYQAHFDYPEHQAICFVVDPATAHRLPRFPQDERYVWFCFQNQEVAATLLGPAGSTGTATIVIDDYTTRREYSDVYDTATLVDVLHRRPEEAAPP
jgi:hypothetical protein